MKSRSISSVIVLMCVGLIPSAALARGHFSGGGSHGGGHFGGGSSFHGGGSFTVRAPAYRYSAPRYERPIVRYSTPAYRYSAPVYGGYSTHWGSPAWSTGTWHHGYSAGRLGWWWGVNNSYYFYDQPVYPYPTVAPVYSAPVAPTPAYFCRSVGGYYPQVPYCPEAWEIVTPQY